MCRKKKGFHFYGIMLTLSFFLMSCTQEKKDGDIKETITSTAKEEINFAGVNYAVSGGVVTLSGHCPSDKGRSQVEQKVLRTPGVKKVVNHIAIAPVVLDDDYPLTQSVDSVLMNAATIQASVEDSTVFLQGQSNPK